MSEQLELGNGSMAARLGQVADEFTDRINRGERPEVEDYARRYPEMAEVLRQVLPTLQVMGPGSAPVEPGGAEAAGEVLVSGCLGDFRIIRKVGRGGMGVVYEAEQISLGRRVALKVLPFAAALDGKQLQRFQNEARAAAGLHHTNIVPVFSVGCERGVHYYAMQFIDGRPLSDLILQLRQAEQGQRGGPRPEEAPASQDRTTAYQAAPRADTRAGATVRAAGSETPLTSEGRRGQEYYRRVAELGVQAAEALDHARQLGIVHRDVKPANLLLGSDGRLWVADFGLAQVRQGEAGLTLSGDLVGTVRYMSPEQALGQRGLVDHRTDVYSLGVTLYELLTLEPAFAGQNNQELLRQIASEEPRPPRRINRAIPAELETIVLKALEKSPADRYGTAQELADDLERFLKFEPIRARRPSLVHKGKKWARRHRGLVGTAAVGAAAVLVTAVGLLALDNAHIRQEQKQTQAEKDRAETRESETTALLEFFENRIFAAARPERQEGGLGSEVTLRRALQAALPSVEKSFTDKPLIEARLRMTLGQSFLHLGDTEIAAEQFQRARTLYFQHRGADDIDTLRSMNNLAASYNALGWYAESLELCEETLALRKITLGPRHLDTLSSMHNLANCYAGLGRHVEALDLRQETLDLYKATLGVDHRNTLLAMHNLANSYYNLGRYNDALNLQEGTLKLLSAKLGPDHPEALRSLTNLANAYADLGKHAKALKARQEVLDLCKTKLGVDHPETLKSMNNLGNSYGALGRFPDALQVHQQTLDLRKAKLGSDHPDTLQSMNNLSNCYAELGRNAEALKLREETLALRKRKQGLGHPDTLVSMHNLAQTYGALGRHADALRLREQTLNLKKVKFGPDHPSTLLTMSDLADNYAGLGRHVEAVQLQQQALAVRKATLGPDHPQTLWSMGRLAVNLVQVDRGAAAVPLIDECVRRAAGKAVHPRLIQGAMDTRLRHFQKTRDAEGCRATAEMWEKLKRTDAVSLYEAACMRAVTAAVLRAGGKPKGRAEDAATEADRAMAWLKQAVAAGFKDVAYMRQDTDLDALRNRADFQELLAALQTQSAAPKKEGTADKK
jgi:serine/threonine protein kinase